MVTGRVGRCAVGFIVVPSKNEGMSNDCSCRNLVRLPSAREGGLWTVNCPKIRHVELFVLLIGNLLSRTCRNLTAEWK